MRTLSSTIRLALFAPALLAGITAATAAHTVDSIPLAPHGDMVDYNTGVVALTPTTFVTSARGDDGDRNSDDDKVLIVTGVGGTPVTTARVVGYLPSGGGRWCRMSATRALYQNAGSDGSWNTGDEQLIIVDRVGSENTVSDLVLGALRQSQGGAHVPVRLTPDSAVIVEFGADNAADTADDRIALVTGLGGTPTVTYLAAPFLNESGRTQPTVLSPTSFLVASNGPDGAIENADDVVYLFTDVGGANTRTTLPVPDLHFGRPGRPVRVTSTMAVVISTGPDSTDETADDLIVVLSGLGTTNTVTTFNVPYIADSGAGRPRVLGPDRLAIPTWGDDGLEGTADDTIAIITDLGGTNTVTHAIVGAMDEDRNCRAVRLAPDRVAVVTYGPDNSSNNADDRLAVVNDAGGANTVTYAAIPGLGYGGAGEPIPLSTSAVLVLSGGPDGDFDRGGDDVATVASSLDGTPAVDHEALGGGSLPTHSYGIASRPALAGGDRAVMMGTGLDGDEGTGEDDVVHVVEGLPVGRTVSVKRLLIKFKATKPQKGEKLSVKADLLLDDPTLFASTDVTISIGNAAETIPADAFVTKKGKPTYKRPKGGTGFLTKVVYSPAKGTLLVTGKGVGTGAESTDAGFIPFTLECGDEEEGLFVGESLAGEAKAFGLKYKRP